MTSAAPGSPSVFWRRAAKVAGWGLFLLVFAIAWYILLSAVAPSRVDFSRGGAAIAVAFAPPILLTLLCWTGVQHLAAPPVVPARAPAAGSSPALPVGPSLPVARFRIGAWSVLTPHGGAADTVACTTSRTAAFKPDKAIVLENGNLAHASIIDDLKLDKSGFPATTRVRLPRIATMLTAILDDLNAQQTRLTDMVEGAVNIYWLLPATIVLEANAGPGLFDAAWKRSAWSEEHYVLHIVPVGPGGGYTVLSVLQEGIDSSVIPYTLVIGADSLLDAVELAPALALEQVFSDAAPRGFIPSEGAAGLLLFNPEKSPEEIWMHAATLAPVARRVLEEVGSPKQTVEDLEAVFSASIVAAAKSADAVEFVVSDADHRPEGVMQITNTMTQLVAHLDPLEQRLSPMEFAGAFGAASDLIHLALAVAVASTEKKLVCSVCNAGIHLASVLIVPAPA